MKDALSVEQVTPVTGHLYHVLPLLEGELAYATLILAVQSIYHRLQFVVVIGQKGGLILFREV